MKRIISRLVFLMVAVTAVSCNKDIISPEELFRDETKVAKTTIHTKGDDSVDTVTTFSNKAVYKKSDMEGQSWLCAFSGGKMVYDAFMLSIYFDNIEKMKVGDELKISHFMFSFIYSSDLNATSTERSGKITLADKGIDYVILRFDKVRLSCSLGDYMTDGYLYCPLFEEFSAN